MSAKKVAEAEIDKAADEPGSQKLEKEIEDPFSPPTDKVEDEVVEDNEEPQDDASSSDGQKKVVDDDCGSRVSDPERYMGKNKDSFCTTERLKLREPMITLFDLKNVRL